MFGFLVNNGFFRLVLFWNLLSGFLLIIRYEDGFFIDISFISLFVDNGLDIFIVRYSIFHEFLPLKELVHHEGLLLFAFLVLLLKVLEIRGFRLVKTNFMEGFIF